MSTQRDTLYQTPQTTVAPFQFNEQVASVFDDMLVRSIPGYATILQQLPVLVGDLLTSERVSYDLGCSLGGAAFALAGVLQERECQSRIIAVDNSFAMIEKLQKRVTETHALIQPICQDISRMRFENADVMVMNFVLMFVAPAQREQLLGDIYQALRPGGALVLSEKVQPNATERDWMQQTYHKYKRTQGYSDTEIAQKQAALTSVLVPDEAHVHEARLQKLGFRTHLWFRQWQFVSWIAVK